MTFLLLSVCFQTGILLTKKLLCILQKHVDIFNTKKKTYKVGGAKIEIVVNRQKQKQKQPLPDCMSFRQAGLPRRHKNKNPKIPKEAPTFSIYRISRTWGHRRPACCEEPRAWWCLDSRNSNISRSTGYHSLSSLYYCPSRMESFIRSFREKPTVPLSANWNPEFWVRSSQN